MNKKILYLTLALFLITSIIFIIFSLKTKDTDNPSTNLSSSIIADNLSVPWQLARLPDERIIFTERIGKVRIIQNNILRPESAIDLQNIISKEGEGGLLGIAADPDFEQNSLLYIYFTIKTDTDGFINKLVRYKEIDSNLFVEEKVLIDNIPGGVNHNGGVLAFGPDKKLYVGVGERYTPDEAQDLNSLSGKILRINTDGTIPKDNPFPNSYIWSYGHRNPQGLTWSTDGKILYSTEHGPSGAQGCCKDEINIIKKGSNYGWPIVTGAEKRDGLESPAWISGSDKTWAPGNIEFIDNGKYKNNLIFTGLRGKSLYIAYLDPKDLTKIDRIEEVYTNEFGRLRGIIELSNGEILFSTSNKDGRGNESNGDDKIIKIGF